jgi:tetratricopeptide (TPR) repeat protein
MSRAPLFCIVLAGAACVTTNLPPLASQNARLEEDERILWRDAEQQEKRFEESGVIYAFAASTRELIDEAARLDLQAGRFSAAERGAKKFVATNPAAARGPFLLGEVARQRHDAVSTEAALASYRKAIELDRGYAQPYRALGLLLLKRGEKPAAREALEKYLELSPAADDRGYVEHDLEALR